jgi:hypothetical protein
VETAISNHAGLPVRTVKPTTGNVEEDDIAGWSYFSHPALLVNVGSSGAKVAIAPHAITDPLAAANLFQKSDIRKPAQYGAQPAHFDLNGTSRYPKQSNSLQGVFAVWAFAEIVKDHAFDL